MIMKNWLPDIIKFEDFKDWQDYEDHLYQVYLDDLYKNSPNFLGLPVRTKYHPPFKKKAFSFWHITHEGPNEDERTPNFRRCERLCWIKPIIEHHSEIKMWVRSDKRNRYYLWCSEEQYLIVLQPKGNYFLLITAFYVDYESQVEKYDKEYEQYS